MARPAKSVNVSSKNLTKDELEIRRAAEQALRGSGELKLTPPDYLNLTQKQIYSTIVNLLEEADILGNTDTYLLEITAIAIDRVRFYETIKNKGKMLDSASAADLKDQRSTFFRCCNELSLSPQSRAKMGTIAVNKQQEDKDPVLSLFKKQG